MPTLKDGGFPPEVWGPHFWFIIHLLAASYPLSPTRQERAAYHAFFKSLQYVLPCDGCKKGYSFLVNGPVPLHEGVFRDRLTLFAFTVALHDAVNKKVGKRTTKDWRQWYTHYDRYRS